MMYTLCTLARRTRKPNIQLIMCNYNYFTENIQIIIVSIVILFAVICLFHVISMDNKQTVVATAYVEIYMRNDAKEREG